MLVTGFLGTGKTTLVQHLLRNRGSLRLAVLVNEVAQVDVDSQLVNMQQVSRRQEQAAKSPSLGRPLGTGRAISIS